MASRKKTVKKKSKITPKKVAIVVAGMHRSGTSALTRVLALMGADLPKTLMPPSKNNESGFWESTIIFGLNEEILASAGSTWDDWTSIPQGWFESTAAIAFQERAQSILAGEFGNSRLFVLKDPRFCRLLQFWIRAIEKFGASPVIMSPVRNPLEVASSLHSRNAYAKSFSYLLWLRHMLDVEYSSRGLPRLFPSYDSLLKNWKSVWEDSKGVFNIQWPRLTKDVETSVNSFLNTELRHHTEKTETIIDNHSLSNWLRTSYSIFNRWASGTESTDDRKSLDIIKNEFNNAVPAFEEIVSLYIVNEKKISENKNELNRIRNESTTRNDKLLATRALLDKKMKELAQWEMESVESGEKFKIYKSMFEEKTGELAKKEAELLTSNILLEKFKTNLNENTSELARIGVESRIRSAQLEEYQTKLANSERELVRRDAEAKANAARLTTLQSSLTELDTKLSDNAEISAELKSRLAENIEQLSRRDAELKAKAEQLDSVQVKLAELDDETSTKTKQLDAALDEIKKLNGDLKSVRDSNTKMQSDQNVLRSELSKLKLQMIQVERENARVRDELSRIHSSWSWKVFQSLKLPVRWREQNSRKRKLKNYVSLIASSSFFDRDWYLEKYPDVKTAGIDPAIHYILYGSAEARDPGPNFSTKWYLDNNKDVVESGINPLVHYLQHGHKEDREISPSRKSLKKKALKINNTAGAINELSVSPTKPNVFYGQIDDREISSSGDFPKKQAINSLYASEVNNSAVEINEQPESPTIPFSIDLPQVIEISWLRQKDFTQAKDYAQLNLTGQCLGLVKSDDLGGDKFTNTFAQSLKAIKVFCRMLDIDERQALLLNHGGSLHYPETAGEVLQNSMAYRDITISNTELNNMITDVWFINDRDLRIRYNTKSDAKEHHYVVRFFQYNLNDTISLMMAAESVLDVSNPGFIDIRLTNPFLPVLVCVNSPDGVMLSASLLPFPSLCRGGFHYGELCALAEKPGYLEKLRMMSGKLLTEMLYESDDVPEFTLGRIEIDMIGATGTERVFTTGFREWLSTVIKIGLMPANSSAITNEKVRGHLINSLATLPKMLKRNLENKYLDRENNCIYKLTLPADSIPTLQVLISRRLGISIGKSCMVGSFIVTDDSTIQPEWSAAMPPLGEELLELQPVNAGANFPVLEKMSDKNKLSNVENITRFPLAIRFFNTKYRDEAKLLMPVALTVSGPLLKTGGSTAHPAAPSVSVILPFCGNEKGALLALLESLCHQDIANSVDIVAVCDYNNNTEYAAKLLDHYFHGKYVLIKNKNNMSLNERINHATRNAKGKFLLITRQNTVLHDPRTLETLCLLADNEKVGSAGCIMVREVVNNKTAPVEFRSGGIYPVQFTATGAVYSELDCHPVFPFATYPVAANTSLLFMVRKDVWRELGGYNDKEYPDNFGDIAYSRKAAEKGFMHFCTTVVSAGVHQSTDSYSECYLNVTLKGSRPDEINRKIADSSSMLVKISQ